MPELHIRARDFGKHLRRRLRQDTDLLRNTALDTALRGETLAVQSTDEKGLVDQGHFKLSWDHRRTHDGAQVGNSSPHSSVIEHGRRPGRPGPPLAPIEEWVRRKLVPEGVVTGRDGGPPTDADIRSAAFAIRRAIHIRGSKPHLILGNLRVKLSRHFRTEAIRRLKAKSRR